MGVERAGGLIGPNEQNVFQHTVEPGDNWPKYPSRSRVPSEVLETTAKLSPSSSSSSSLPPPCTIATCAALLGVFQNSVLLLVQTQIDAVDIFF